MGDEDRGEELPQRVRDAPRGAPHPPDSPPAPLLSAELRQRLAAAVTAERSEAAGPERAAQPLRTANAGPVTEDEVTEWLAIAANPGSAETRSAEPPSAERGPDAEPGAGQLAGRRDRCSDHDPRTRHRVAVRRGGQAPGRTAGECPVQRRPGAPGGGDPRGGGCLDRPAGKPRCDGVLRSGDVRGARGARAPRARPARARAALARSPPLRPGRRDGRRPGAVRYQPRPGLGAGRPRVLRLRGRGHHRPGRSPRMEPSRTRPRSSPTWPPGRRPAPGC